MPAEEVSGYELLCRICDRHAWRRYLYATKEPPTRLTSLVVVAGDTPYTIQVGDGQALSHASLQLIRSMQLAGVKID